MRRGVEEARGSARRAMYGVGSGLAVAVAAVACGSPPDAGEAEAPAEATQAGVLTAGVPTRVARVEGFDIPESMQHDPVRDVYYVSNVAAHATRRSNDGFISRLGPDGTVQDLRFIAGGQGGVTLHAPKGLLVSGDTIWVTDIDHLRSFDANTGTPLQHADLSGAGAIFLNDLDRGPDGALYVTDSGLRFGDEGGPEHTGPDRIYRVAPGGEVSLALEDARLESPNGIAWDPNSQTFVVVSLFGTGVWSWVPGEAEAIRVTTGAGGFDGVVALPDGRVYVSSQEAGAVQLLWSGGRLEDIVPDLGGSTGDIGFDRVRHRVLVPLLGENRVEIWSLPTG